MTPTITLREADAIMERYNDLLRVAHQLPKVQPKPDPLRKFFEVQQSSGLTDKQIIGMAKIARYLRAWRDIDHLYCCALLAAGDDVRKVPRWAADAKYRAECEKLALAEAWADVEQAEQVRLTASHRDKLTAALDAFVAEAQAARTAPPVVAPPRYSGTLGDPRLRGHLLSADRSWTAGAKRRS